MQFLGSGTGSKISMVLDGLTAFFDLKIPNNEPQNKL